MQGAIAHNESAAISRIHLADDTVQLQMMELAQSCSADARAASEQEEVYSASCDRELEHVQLRLRLALLGAHLKRATSGTITLSRLSADDPLHKRCCSNALDSIKPGVFSRDAVHNGADGSSCVVGDAGLNVLDVYQLEHQPLQRRFQQAAQAAEALEVAHGLFCGVPLESLEHAIACGIGGNAAAAAALPLSQCSLGDLALQFRHSTQEADLALALNPALTAAAALEQEVQRQQIRERHRHHQQQQQQQ
ncbi:hypothetical protein JKP88DRAFT_300574 [Tribonema minus]|uniref:Uncharacterized protein n=1 Tax=Tribonema minus TaxID=303371 RepID=A0A836CKD8_9STRA|nr:hypothetical protein JKP88DRAFT_300574 [Tribonema minus]